MTMTVGKKFITALSLSVVLFEPGAPCLACFRMDGVRRRVVWHLAGLFSSVGYALSMDGAGRFSR